MAEATWNHEPFESCLGAYRQEGAMDSRLDMDVVFCVAGIGLEISGLKIQALDPETTVNHSKPQ